MRTSINHIHMNSEFEKEIKKYSYKIIPKNYLVDELSIASWRAVLRLFLLSVMEFYSTKAEHLFQWNFF